MDLFTVSLRSSSVLCFLKQKCGKLIIPSFQILSRPKANNVPILVYIDKKSYRTRVRNAVLPEKTKAIRSNVLEVIYGGKEKVPAKVSWGVTNDDDIGNDLRKNHPANGILTNLKQRAFLKESSAYQASSLEYIHVLQGEQKESTAEKADAFLSCISKHGEELSESDLMKGIHHLCVLPQEAREQRLKSLGIGFAGDQMCRAMPSMTTEEFLRCLLVFYWWEIPLASNQNSLIEKECLQRMSSWNANTLLVVSDWWICKSGATSWAFHEQMLVQLRRQWTGLTSYQMVQAFYLCGQFKRHTRVLMEKLTLLAERLVDDLSLTEIATICNGFIKSAGRLPQKSLLPSVISKSLSRATIQQTDRDLYNVVTILRFLGRSYHHDKALYNRVAEILLPHIPKMEHLALPHVAAVYARAQLIHTPLFEGILKAFNHSKANLKDYYLTLWAYCRLNFSSADFAPFTDMAVSRITEEEVWTRDAPFLFVKTLIPLTYIGKFPQELLSRAFSQAYLRRYKGQCPPDVYKHLYCVDCSLAIECPDYSGNRLPGSVAQRSPWALGSSKVVTDEDREYAEIIPLLSEVLGGKEYLLIHPILDHIRTPVDIEVHLDHHGNPVDLHRQARHSLDPCVKLAVLIGPEGQYVRDSRSLLGVHVMKRRQLKTVGYEIVEIPFFEWQLVKKQNKTGKKEYLSQKLYKR